MSYGFGEDDKPNIPGQAVIKNSETVQRKVPKSIKISHSSKKEITKAATELTSKGLLNERSSLSVSDDNQETQPRKMGRPRKIKTKDTMTLTGEKKILDDFRKYCNINPDKSFVENLGKLLQLARNKDLNL